MTHKGRGRHEGLSSSSIKEEGPLLPTPDQSMEARLHRPYWQQARRWWLEPWEVAVEGEQVWTHPGSHPRVLPQHCQSETPIPNGKGCARLSGSPRPSHWQRLHPQLIRPVLTHTLKGRSVPAAAGSLRARRGLQPTPSPLPSRKVPTACSFSVSSRRRFLHLAAANLFLSLRIRRFSSSSGDNWKPKSRTGIRNRANGLSDISDIYIYIKYILYIQYIYIIYYILHYIYYIIYDI